MFDFVFKFSHKRSTSSFENLLDVIKSVKNIKRKNIKKNLIKKNKFNFFSIIKKKSKK